MRCDGGDGSYTFSTSPEASDGAMSDSSAQDGSDKSIPAPRDDPALAAISDDVREQAAQKWYDLNSFTPGFNPPPMPTASHPCPDGNIILPSSSDNPQ